LVPPLFLPTPGAWIVTTLWTFGVVLLTEKINFTLTWWLLIGGIAYLTGITIIWAWRCSRHSWSQRIIACLMISVVGVLAWLWTQYIINNVEAKTFIAIEFKSSPVLTLGRRKHILRNLTAFHDYLKAIRFDIKKEEPFLLGTLKTTAPVRAFTHPGTPYDDMTKIYEHAITKDNQVQAAYARFVFEKLLRQHEPITNDFHQRSPGIFSSYYVSSHRHISRCGGSSNNAHR
jgi:hypothetical protein